MNKIFKYYTIALLFVLTVSFSNFQNNDIKGIVKYKALINTKYVDSFIKDLEKKEDLPMHIKQGVVDMYRNAQPDEFNLFFKDGKSYYSLIPKLDTDEGYNIGSKANKNSYFTSTTDIIEESSYFGNIKHNPLDWEITNNTKKIGKYNCNQAIATEKLFSRKGFYYNRQIVAWFTPDIPLSFGPSNYSGLPGLILEIECNMFSIRAMNIDLSSSKNIVINKPSGKIITEEQSHKLIKGYMKDSNQED
ncbi:GLPGLI family protein [Mesoflavibacter sp. CH_XMU1422-2]|uniref:GLPGLI family protein n=1 Tax=Mesoflavibacter sp. CH_XMU1422-2 TaxID=3107770 RepID=UPI0030090026